MLAELHQVVMVQGEDNSTIEFSVRAVKRCGKADYPLILPAAQRLFRIGSRAELLLFADMEAGNVGNINLPFFQGGSFFKVVFAFELGVCGD